MNNGVNNVIVSVFTPKLFPNIRVASTNKGMEIHNDIVAIGICNIVENTIERPVIPPGAKVVEAKKKLTAIAVSSAEIDIQP